MKIEARNNEFLSLRVQLTSVKDEISIPSPGNGRIVSHPGLRSMEAGIYANQGTTMHPPMVLYDDHHGDETQGVPNNKVEYIGRNLDTDGFPKPTLHVPDLNLEFRFAQNGTTHGLEVRLMIAPSAMVNFKATGDMRGTTRLKFTTANYNVWQYMGPTNEWWAYFCFITTDEPSSLSKTCVFYAISSYGNHGVNNNRETYFLASEV